MSAKHIRIHIEHLVLEGFAGVQPEALRAALATELATLIGASDRPLAAAGRAAYAALEREAALPPASAGAALGAELARTLHGGMTS